MSSAILAINAVLFLTFGPLCIASHLSSTFQLDEKRNENSHDINKVNSQEQANLLGYIGPRRCRSTNSREDHYQIHEQNLNGDFPMANLVRSGGQKLDFSLKNSSSEASFGDKDASICDEKPVLNELVDKIKLDDMASYKGDILQTPNDTTKLSFTDLLNLSGSEKLPGEEQGNYFLDDHGIINNCGSEIFFVNRPQDDDTTIDLLSLNGVKNMKENMVKRENIPDKGCDPSNETIEEQINKVYKDISDNVKLLSKLRDQESHMFKKPSKKRWIIVDNTIDDNTRKKKYLQELTVEMDTSKDATPDRLEHIERKVEEELLQVNVPLKSNQ